MNPYPTRPQPGGPAAAPYFRYQQAVPAQRLQSSIIRQSHADIDLDPFYNEPPSAEQYKAATILQEIRSDTLKGIRSCLRGEQLFDTNLLSPQQFRAALILKDYPDDALLKLLNLARSPGTVNASQNLHGNSNLRYDRVAGSSLGQSLASNGDPSIHIAPRNPFDQEPYNPSRGPFLGEQSSPVANSNDHNHWCPECEKPRIITTCKGFKRHMREHHEKRFYCMPQGPIVHTEDGPKCAFCGDLEPDRRHLSTHNVEPCASKLPAARSFSREYQLINHLKNHNVADGSVLAKQWRNAVDKKYFACGFCISWFGSHKDLVKHIDAIHYKFSEHFHDWDSDKVIRGHLSRPILNEHWRRALAANPHLRESSFKWNPKLAKNLQHRLEMSQEPEDVLCRAAMDESNHGSSHGYVDWAPVTGPEVDDSQSIQKFQPQNLLSPLPSTSEQSSIHDRRMRSPTLQSQHLPWDWDRVNKSNWDTTYEGRPPQIASQTYELPVSAVHYHADHRAQPHSLPNGDESLTQQQYPRDVPLVASASGSSQPSEGQAGNSQSSRLGEHPQGVSPYGAVNPRPKQMIDTQGCSAQPHTGWINSAPMSLSRNHPTSPLHQLTSASSPCHCPSTSRPDMIECNGIYMDADSNNMHPFMQNQHHTQDQRRFH